jgi:hypothetical protein
MKISNYLPIILYLSIASITGLFLDRKSVAQGNNCVASPGACASAKQLVPGKLLLAQNTESTPPASNPSNDLDNKISIPPNQEDKSLLKVKASITNRGEYPHYVYYIVAKFVSGDTPIKEAIIPVNSTIEPGKTADVTHEISKESFSSLSVKNIKPIIVKSEYR